MTYKPSASTEKEKVSLRQVRKKLNLTQKQIASILGTGYQNISDIERGVEIPDWIQRAVTLNQLFKDAGYSLEDLIFALPDSVEASDRIVSNKYRTTHE